MSNQKKFIVSHAPFWHDGTSISQRSYHTIFAAIPAILIGIAHYGIPAVGVVCLTISSAILWELAFNKISKRPVSIGDGNAAVIGTILAMLLPPTIPWWAVIIGTFVGIIIGKQIYGGIGANPLNPVGLAAAILMLSWGGNFDFNQALANYELNFSMAYPLHTLKNFGVSAIGDFHAMDLLMGKQVGGIGATFGLGLILAGLYLIIRGFIRWEISLSFLAGIALTAFIFNVSAPEKYAGAGFHLLTGYTLVAAFFLAPEDSSSPVNFLPMLIYGLSAGVLTVLIRNIGADVDGTIFAILFMNIINPLLDKIRPKATGKVTQHA